MSERTQAIRENAIDDFRELLTNNFIKMATTHTVGEIIDESYEQIKAQKGVSEYRRWINESRTTIRKKLHEEFCEKTNCKECKFHDESEKCNFDGVSYNQGITDAVDSLLEVLSIYLDKGIGDKQYRKGLECAKTFVENLKEPEDED